MSRHSTVVLSVLAFSLSIAVSADLEQGPPQNDRVDVLINFTSRPGQSDRALVEQAGGRIRFTYSIVPAMAVNLPRAAATALAANPRVSFIEDDVEVFAEDAELDDTWGVKAIGAGAAHEAGTPILGAGINVAVIDTGIDYTHPDLAANYRGGFDFLNDDADPMDDCGHGTHVAGTIGALKNAVGVVGVAPAANLYALKFMGPSTGNKCSGPISAALAAIDWAVQHGIHITNNSWGGGGFSTTVDAAFANSAALGMLHVASAGNNGTCDGAGENTGYPANYRSVIAVAAIDSTDTRACFSSTGPNLELSAPGVQVRSTIRGGNYGSNWSGTSMASPHVAGTAALLLSQGILDANANGRVNDEVRNALAMSALDLGTPGRDEWYGFGRVRVPEALDAAEAAPPLTLSVDRISYALSGGGRGKNKDMTVTVGTVYGLVVPVAGTVQVTLTLNGSLYQSVEGTTDQNGQVSFLFRNSPAGAYATTVTWASSGGLTWDGRTPANGIVK
jgi:subtilisin family serine protease